MAVSSCASECVNFGTCVDSLCRCPALYDGPDCSDTRVRDSATVRVYLACVIGVCVLMTLWSLFGVVRHLRLRRGAPNTSTLLWLCVLMHWPLIALEKSIDPALAISDGHNSLAKPIVVAASRAVFVAMYSVLLATWRHVITDTSHLAQSIVFTLTVSAAMLASVAAMVRAETRAAHHAASRVFMVLDTCLFLLFCGAVPVLGAAVTRAAHVSHVYAGKVKAMLYGYAPAMLIAIPLRLLSPFVAPMASASVVLGLEIAETTMFLFLDAQMMLYVSHNSDIQHYVSGMLPLRHRKLGRVGASDDELDPFAYDPAEDGIMLAAAGAASEPRQRAHSDAAVVA